MSGVSIHKAVVIARKENFHVIEHSTTYRGNGLDPTECFTGRFSYNCSSCAVA